MEKYFRQRRIRLLFIYGSLKAFGTINHNLLLPKAFGTNNHDLLLAKAFGTINYDLLLAKLKADGFLDKSSTLMCSYLKNRKQRTQTNNYFSSEKMSLREFHKAVSLEHCYLIYL